MSETRQSYREIVLVAEWKRERGGFKESMVTVRCGCGRELKMPKSRWQNSPPERCLKCSTKAKKKGGYHGFRARR